MSVIPAARLYACADLDEARRGEFEATYSPHKSFRDYHDLLQDPAVDAVMICLPNFLHFPASLAALETDRHVFCEKRPTLFDDQDGALETVPIELPDESDSF